MTPLIGRKPWFGPRRFGWGLSPVSAEGWAVTAGTLAVAAGLAVADRGHRWIALLAVGVLLLLTFLKGTSPGGPGAWQEFRDRRDSRGGS